LRAEEATRAADAGVLPSPHEGGGQGEVAEREGDS